MRELMTPTLGGTNKLSASFKAANGNGVARQAASKIMEPTKAYTASKRPSIPYVKKESRWGPRYVLRKPSEYTAFNTVKAVPAAEEKPAVTEEKPVVEEKPTAMEVKSTEEKPVAAEEKPVAAEKPAMTEEKPTVAEETEEVPTPESSEGVAPKESISTSPEHVASLPGEREEDEKKRQPEGSFCILF